MAFQMEGVTTGGVIGGLVAGPVGGAIGRSISKGGKYYELTPWGQYFTAKDALMELQKQPYPEFGTVDEWGNVKSSVAEAQKASKTGLTQQEKATWNQNLAGQSLEAYRRGSDVGGGSLQSAIGSGINAMQIEGIGKMSAEDARLKLMKKQYADKLAADLATSMQGQQNLKTQAEIQRRMALEQGWGNAMAQGIQNTYQLGSEALKFGTQALSTGAQLAA